MARVISTVLIHAVDQVMASDAPPVAVGSAYELKKPPELNVDKAVIKDHKENDDWRRRAKFGKTSQAKRRKKQRRR